MQEKWIWIKGYEGFYQISDYGRVKNFKWNKNTGRLLSPKKNSQGYYQVVLYLSGIKKAVYIARLVALYFIPNPENKPEVNHIDGNRINNHYKNLEWVTHSENQIHSYRILKNINSGYQKGENHYRAKLTWEKVKEIRELYKTEKFNKIQLGNMFMVTKENIYRIVTNKIWVGEDWRK